MRTVTYKVYQKDWVTKEGRFHCWGITADEDAKISWSVGIVEDANGNIDLVNPEHITFTFKETELPW